MSKLSQLRSAWHYETNVPRCESCIHVRKPYIYLKTDSIPRQSSWHCKAGCFDVRPNACCDRWKSKKGEVIA